MMLFFIGFTVKHNLIFLEGKIQDDVLHKVHKQISLTIIKKVNVVLWQVKKNIDLTEIQRCLTSGILKCFF
jgi:hypothetical protein